MRNTSAYGWRGGHRLTSLDARGAWSAGRWRSPSLLVGPMFEIMIAQIGDDFIPVLKARHNIVRIALCRPRRPKTVWIDLEEPGDPCHSRIRSGFDIVNFEGEADDAGSRLRIMRLTIAAEGLEFVRLKMRSRLDHGCIGLRANRPLAGHLGDLLRGIGGKVIVAGKKNLPA